MKSIRTPEERFSRVKDFPYVPRYLTDLEGFEGLRVHYVDEGSHDKDAHGPPFLTPYITPIYFYIILSLSLSIWPHEHMRPSP